jgi:hypothetical protein
MNTYDISCPLYEGVGLASDFEKQTYRLVVRDPRGGVVRTFDVDFSAYKPDGGLRKVRRELKPYGIDVPIFIFVWAWGRARRIKRIIERAKRLRGAA